MESEQLDPEKQIEKASFIATFPDTQSAISMHGNGGMRILLEIPENELPNAIALAMWRGRAMRVVITPLKQSPNSGWKE